MAENLVVKYRLITSPQPPTFISGHYILVNWDDVNNKTKVYHGSLFDGTVPEHEITTGPDLKAFGVDFVALTNTSPIPYSFCDGLNLQTFEVKSTFPYVTKISNPNHFSCASTVCDIQISDNYTVQAASDFVTADGSINVTATSSNGTIKYNLNGDFDYNTQGYPTGEFYNLFAGDYTVIAKDAIGCIDQITITVPVPNTYGAKYRLDYRDINGTPTRVDILERGYSSSPIDVKGDDDPFILKYNGDGELDKFTTIIPSEARLTLIAQSNFYFQDLFSQDERKYQLKYYKDYGNLVSPFTPAVLPSLSSWTNVPNPSISGWDWVTGATPTVDFGNAGTGFSHGLNTRSDLLYTNYTFEAGRSYSFGYNFIGITSPSGWSPTDATYKIQIVDAAKTVLIEKNVPYVYSSGASTGTYDFVAPTNAAGIAIVVFVAPAGSQHTYTVQSFTNLTQSIPGGSAGYELKWFGYLICSNYREAYLKPPYPVTIIATDGLADLKTYDFLDAAGNKFQGDLTAISAINEILSKTDLPINLQSAINRYEDSMSKTSVDDPLPQCKFDPKTFYNGDQVSNCSDVLSEILKPFGARILQRNGKWFVYSIEQTVTSANYREFDTNVLFAASGSVNDTVNIKTPILTTRAAFRNQDQVLEILPSYGKLFFEHTLIENDSLVPSYSFEIEDITTNPSGLVVFRNWNVGISNAPGATYGIKKTKDLDGDYNFYANPSETTADNTPVNPPSLGGKHIILTAIPFQIEYSSNDIFEFGFESAVLLKLSGSFRAPLWIRIRWTLQIGSYYYNEESGSWTTDSLLSKNSFFISTYNAKNEFKIVGLFRNVVQTTEETVRISFYLEAVNYKDFNSFSNLKSITTTNKAAGHKLKGENYPDRHYYVLENSTHADSNPDYVRPNDYASGTNEKVWVQERIIPPNAELPVDYFYIDNVLLRHNPNGEEPPDNITIERSNNAGIKVNFEETYLLNDIDTVNINNSERTYRNFFKKLNGTPTQTWSRTYRAGSGKLLDLLSDDVVSQYKLPSDKLTGSILSDVEVLPSSVLIETNNNNKKYMFMGYELHDKEYTIGFDLHEIKDVVTDSGSGNIDAGFTTGFSLGFRS